MHTCRSSNLTFFLAVWSAAKACKGLVHIDREFHWDATPSRAAKRHMTPKKMSAQVDIVADDGAEWVKVSTVTATRIIYEKAKAGWTSDSGSEGDDGGVRLLKAAFCLQRASQCTFVRYKHPRIRFVLPNIHAGTSPEVDAVLDSIRKTGAIVQCAQDLPAPQSVAELSHHNSPDSLTSIFERLLIDPHTYLTSTLNIDCTILLALVSDLSNAEITEPELRLNRHIRRQVDIETKSQLLPTSLWPAMRGRNLVCTAAAAKRMREIVEIVGSPTEKARTELLLGEGDLGEGLACDKLIQNFQKFSMHVVPTDWNLPVKVKDDDVDFEELPKVAKKVSAELSDINRSVFLYGWARGYTTCSSNCEAHKLIRGIIEASSKEEGGELVEGPKVWLHSTARSLVGKEIRRR